MIFLAAFAAFIAAYFIVLVVVAIATRRRVKSPCRHGHKPRATCPYCGPYRTSIESCGICSTPLTRDTAQMGTLGGCGWSWVCIDKQKCRERRA
jgi:hypothetical protein